MLTDKQWKQIEENINNMSDEEFAEKFLVDKNSINSSWHPSKQNSFYLCWYCAMMAMLIYVQMEWAEDFVQNVEKEQRRNF